MSLKPDSTTRPCDRTEAQISGYFDARVAELVARGEDQKLSPVSESLGRLLMSFDPTNRTVLELGSGRGGLLLQLLAAGAERATGVDLSPASIDVASERFRKAQLSDRVQLSVGDAARVPLEPHDWVILDRVICCYADVERLLANTLPAARHVYAFTVPTSHGWRGVVARVGWWIDNFWDRLRGRPCPGYVHNLDNIEERLANAGFQLRQVDRHGLWHIAIYERGI